MQEKKDTEHIRKTLAYYQELMDNSGDYIFSVTEKGKLLFTNKHFQTKLHYTEEQFKNLNFISALHYGSNGVFKKLFSVISSHENVTLRLTSRIGTEIIINGNCTIYKEDQEFILKGLFHDVTVAFNKNKGLELSEVKFKLLFEKTLNPIVYYDPKGIIDCNEAFLHILGYSNINEIQGMVPSDFSATIQPGTDDPIRAAWKISNLALQNGGHRFEWMYKKKTGEEFLVAVSLSLIELDARRVYFAVWNDITERYREENSIRTREAKMKSKNERLRLLNDINQLLIQDIDFLHKTKNILKSITQNLGIYTTNISIINAEMSELTSYAYSSYGTGKFYDGKKYRLNIVPGIKQLLQGDIYHNPNIEENQSQGIEDRLYKYGLKSVISIPISLDDHTLGLISIADQSVHAFDEGLVSLLIDVSKSMALFIDQYNLTELNRKYGQLEESLHQLGTKILSQLNIQEIGESLYSEVNEIMDAPIFGFGLFNESENTLEFKNIIEYDEALPPFNLDLTDLSNLGTICFNNGMDIVINNIERDISKYTSIYDRSKIPGKKPESLVYLPLVFKGEKIGVITAQSYSKNKYGDKNVFILKILANYIAIAAHNAHKFESAEEQVDIKTREIIMQKIQLQKTNYHQRIINLIGQKISTEADLDEIFLDMYDKISQLMDTTIFGIRIYHHEKEVMEYNYEIESGLRAKYGFISINDSNNYSNWCLNNSNPIFINDNSIEYKKYVSEIQTSYEEISESLLYQPLILNDERLGVLTVQSYNKNAYNKAHLDMLGNVANYTCLAIKNQLKKERTVVKSID